MTYLAHNTCFVKFPHCFFFSRYKAYRDEQARLHAAWLERENARQAAIARGDPNPPPAELDPTDAATVHEIGLLGLCKFLVYVILVVLLAGKFVTGEWFWGGEADVRKTLGKLWPTEQRVFSESLLAGFDGSDPHKPIYLAVRCFALLCVGVVAPGTRVSAFCRFCFLPWPFSWALAWQVRAQLSAIPLCQPCCAASSVLTKLILTICIYCRSTETSMMYQVIVASMVQGGPTHLCTLTTFPLSPYGSGVLC